jgi:hypothetical protein
MVESDLPWLLWRCNPRILGVLVEALVIAPRRSAILYLIAVSTMLLLYRNRRHRAAEGGIGLVDYCYLKPPGRSSSGGTS